MLGARQLDYGIATLLWKVDHAERIGKYNKLDPYAELFVYKHVTNLEIQGLLEEIDKTD
jgi:hypothetical protein